MGRRLFWEKENREEVNIIFPLISQKSKVKSRDIVDRIEKLIKKG